jgi:hypothetical protein
MNNSEWYLQCMNESEWYLQYTNESEWYLQYMNESEWYLQYTNKSNQYLQYSMICTFSSFNEKWQERMGKYHSWLLMTDITCCHLPFMNSREKDILKQSHPINLSSRPIMSCPILFISPPRMAISLMLAYWGQSHKNFGSNLLTLFCMLQLFIKIP